MLVVMVVQGRRSSEEHVVSSCIYTGQHESLSFYVDIISVRGEKKFISSLKVFSLFIVTSYEPEKAGEKKTIILYKIFLIYQRIPKGQSFSIPNLKVTIETCGIIYIVRYL